MAIDIVSPHVRLAPKTGPAIHEDQFEDLLRSIFGDRRGFSTNFGGGGFEQTFGGGQSGGRPERGTDDLFVACGEGGAGVTPTSPLPRRPSTWTPR